jgi:hypothetical protein
VTDPTRRLPRAIDLAIQSLTDARRKYAPGHAAYLQGIRVDVIKDKRVTGTGFTWAEEDYRKHEEYSQAIQEMEDLKEILADPGVVIDPEYKQEPML